MVRRIAVVHKAKCNPTGCGGYLCIKVNPENRMGKECIVVDPIDKKIKINEEACGLGVQISANRCPYHAIDIINLPEQLTVDPIHRYGQNGFCLYKLPTPVFGKVVGLIGRNGIGKSTALKIVAGLMKPNLGTDKEASYDEVLKFFKGSESQQFFEDLRDNKITASFKPQQVDLIPETAKGLVKDLLTKVDEKGKYDAVIKGLDLTNVVNTDISKVSGGELQRIAIAACVLKKANLYIFDEPTSYLDIKQRLKVGEFIRSLVDVNTAVLVVEHDLIILDYLADLIQIMYGKEGCYGIVSLPKVSKQGINIFLDGYMKDENMRFRDHSIKFLSKIEEKRKQSAPLTSWNGIKKLLGKFSLSAPEGSLLLHDTVGIVGENGIGKTSFVKILAGVDKPDAGEFDKTKVSYKPQYIDTKSEVIVASVLKDAISKYEVQLVRPLGIKDLMMKRLCDLSGGELQRVSICHALAQEADLYLLDEPSAYLDVEQRIEVAKVIHDVADSRNCSVLVVDHDLLFVDYISRKIMVFDGVPAISGIANAPSDLHQGMNSFMKRLDITMRRDPENNRPRINKKDSVLDREQRQENKYYY